ncbi:MAG TPA: hypothetical protein VGJ00_02660 [Rhabdochlamydiaceae bacterium]|jgi:hypothetical protein
MHFLILLPFLLQTLIILFDEFYFHCRRGLPRWERIGHPLDTLSVLLCFLYVLLFPCTALHLKIYIGLALFSCVLVTKDEFVHKDCCPASEQWLHACLFLNHPIMLSLLGFLWPVYKSPSPPPFLASLAEQRGFLGAFLLMQSLLIGLFALYQILYWNFLRKENEAHQ